VLLKGKSNNCPSTTANTFNPDGPLPNILANFSGKTDHPNKPASKRRSGEFQRDLGKLRDLFQSRDHLSLAIAPHSVAIPISSPVKDDGPHF